MKNSVTKTKSDAWYTDDFAIIPLQAVRDKRMGPRQLQVLIVLASFANRSGNNVFPSRAHIAELCGFFVKGEPHVQLVSALISNPNYAKPNPKTGKVKNTGPGLVELGYVEKIGQRAENETNIYRVKTPDVADEHLNFAKDRKVSNEVWKAKKKADADAIGLAFAAKINAEYEAEEQAFNDDGGFDD